MAQPAAPVSGTPIRARNRSLWSRIGNFVLWYTVPGIAILLSATYIFLAVVWDVNPPVVPVAGDSMEPTIQAGDLVILKGIDADDVDKGDIVAVRVPENTQKKYGLPAAIVHRVTKITEEGDQRVFETQGDANPGPDVFETREPDIVGVMYKRIEDAGLPLLFFRSRQGYIFLAATALVIALYFLFGVLEERRFAAQASAVTMHTVLAETQDLKQALGLAPPDATRGPPEETIPTEAATAPIALRPLSGFETLAHKIEDSTLQNEQMGRTMRDLVGAVGEYGQHLQSHTEVMKNLALTTAELQKATEAMRALFERGGTPPTQPPSDEDMPAALFDAVEEAGSTPDGSPPPTPPTALLVPPPPTTLPPLPTSHVPPAPTAAAPTPPQRVPEAPRAGPPSPPPRRIPSPPD